MACGDRKKRLRYHRDMVKKLETELFEGVSGLASTASDGVSTSFNRRQQLEELEYHRKMVRMLERGGKRFRTIGLGNSHD